MTSIVDMDGLGRSILRLVPQLEDLYEDLHAHPELSFAEHRTAGVAADALDRLGFDVTTGVGGRSHPVVMPAAPAMSRFVVWP